MGSHGSLSLCYVLTLSAVLVHTMYHAASVDEARAFNLRAVVFVQTSNVMIEPSGQRQVAWCVGSFAAVSISNATAKSLPGYT